MSWFKKRPEKPLRDQLLEARSALQRQIQVLGGGPSYSAPTEGQYMRDQAAELAKMIQDIDDELAKLDGPSK